MKIFCIGLPKTGTTTLGKALEILGYSHNSETDSVLGLNSITDGTYDYIIDQIGKYDAFEDSPYPMCWKWLAEKYPDAKFILTTRESPYKFLLSLLNEPLRKIEGVIHHQKKFAQFGVTHVKGNEGIVYRAYLEHNHDVRKYFEGKDNFIEMCFEDGHGWKRLCAFLAKEIPTQDFPHLNKTNDLEK